MALPPLASIAQLEARTGRTVDNAARAQALLEDASAVIRAYTRQTLTRVEDDTALVPYDRGRIELPQWPADKPTTIALPDGTGAFPSLAWYWNGGGEVVFLQPGQIANGPSHYAHRYTSMDTLLVTYSHGYQPDELPGELVMITCQMVDRVLNGVADSPGVMAEAIDDYNYKLGGMLTSGTIGLVPEETRLLDRYRRGRVRSVRMQA